MSLEQDLQEVKALVFNFGNAAVQIHEQLHAGNWVDDHGHDVKKNLAIHNLMCALQAANDYAQARGAVIEGVSS